MQLQWDQHFREIVLVAWQAYRAAEQRLSDAIQQGDAALIHRARFDVLREGGAASFYLHHFMDVVLRARPEWLPNDLPGGREEIGAARRWLGQHCTFLRGELQIGDVTLLKDVADALKHAILDNQARRVAANEAVLVVGTGFGELRFGEGKFGGGEQAIVLADDGPRALSSILQNVIDAWRRVAGLDLPAIGQP